MRSRYRPRQPSFKMCDRLAHDQGLAVYKLPGYRGKGLRNRYAVGRADQGAQADFITYVGIRALYVALKGLP